MTGIVLLVLAVAGCGLLPEKDRDPGRQPDWKAPIPGGETAGEMEAAVGADTVLVTQGRSVRGLDRRDGAERWSFPAPEGDDDRVAVVLAGDVVAVSEDAESGFWLEVLDLRSGNRLWGLKAPPEQASVTVLHDAIYLVRCTPAPATPCEVSRRDPRTGAVRWSLRQPDAHPIAGPDLGSQIGGAEMRGLVAQRSGPYVVLPTGREPRYQLTVLDARTGQRLASVPHPEISTILTPRMLVLRRPLDELAQDPTCPYELRGLDARTGAERWRTQVSTHLVKRDDKPGCAPLLSNNDYALGLPPDTLLATTADGRPQAFDLTTGRTRWTAQDRGVPVEVDGRVVLVQDARQHGRLRVLDLQTGRQLWQGQRPRYGNSTLYGAVSGSSVLEWSVGDDAKGEVAVRRASDGHERWVTPPDSGHLIAVGDGWFATLPYSGDTTQSMELRFYELDD